jgi:hypothetical protein
VAVPVGVAVSVGALVEVSGGAIVAVSVGACVAVALGSEVAVPVGVEVCTLVGLALGRVVEVAEGCDVGVSVAAEVRVAVGVSVGRPPPESSSPAEQALMDRARARRIRILELSIGKHWPSGRSGATRLFGCDGGSWGWRETLLVASLKVAFAAEPPWIRCGEECDWPDHLRSNWLFTVRLPSSTRITR